MTNLKIIEQQNKINQWYNIGKYIVFCLLFLFGAFLIPDCFINRHITSEVFGIAAITIIITFLSLICIKSIQLTLSNLLIVLFISFWGLSQSFNTWLPIQNQVHFLSLCTLFFLLSSWAFDRRTIKNYFIIGIVAALLMSFWGIAQYLDIVRVFHNGFPVTGSFDNPAGIGIFLAALFPFTLFYIRNESNYKKIGAICISIILITTVILSQSRTALLAIIIVGTLELSNVIKVPKYIYTYKYTFIITALLFCFIILYLLYNWKVDSATGRLFIWQISWNMFLNHWLLGAGAGSFQAEYMLFQAEYFQSNPQSEFVMIADNVLHPFNEYLKLLIEYGMLGFSIITLFIILLIKQYRQYCFNHTVRPIFLSLIVIGISALFSYPFKYPAIGIILVINLAIISSLCFNKIHIRKKFIVVAFKIVMFLFVSFLTYLTINGVIAERTWYKTVHSSLLGNSEKNISTYTEISKWLNYDGLFLYNFGAELNYIGRYGESNEILFRCSKLFNDVDVQLLIADNYFNLKNYTEAEYHLLLASNMCPIRFLPFYKLFILYTETGHKVKSTAIGEKILNKPIKVSSSTIKYIKKDVEQRMVSF